MKTYLGTLLDSCLTDLLARNPRHARIRRIFHRQFPPTEVFRNTAWGWKRDLLSLLSSWLVRLLRLLGLSLVHCQTHSCTQLACLAIQARSRTADQCAARHARAPCAHVLASRFKSPQTRHVVNMPCMAHITSGCLVACPRVQCRQPRWHVHPCTFTITACT